jgi:hypothetical protein
LIINNSKEFKKFICAKNQKKEKTMDELLKEVEKIAKEMEDGHFMILKFTSGYKGFFGTPNLDIGEEREIVSKLPNFQTFEEV